MNTENPFVGALRQQWLALVALVSVGAAFVGQSSKTTETVPTKSTSAIVSYSERIWDDPFSLVEPATKALEANASVNSKTDLPAGSPLEFNTIFDFIKTLTKNQQSHILVCLNVLDAQGIPSATESRIRTRHAFEIGMSSMKFSAVDPDSISFLQVSLAPSPSPLAKSHDRKKVVLPIKLYQHRESKKVVLNIWFDQQFLGDAPWHSIATVLGNIPKDMRSSSKLAIVGPGDSDKLKAMKPIAGHYLPNELWGSFWVSPNTSADESGAEPKPTNTKQKTPDYQFDGLEYWKERYWVSTSSTVPRDVLWGEVQPYTPKEFEKNEFKFRSFIDSDRRLISSLAKELRLRIGTYSPKQHDILLFVEQDKEYGRKLGSLLTEKLEDNFTMRTVPYLRGLRSDEKAKVEANGVNVTDYFERTLARLTDAENFATSQIVSPAAIGILGGSWNDKIVLVETVRRRFPQALIFTNDYDERYGDPNRLTTTRNLLIVSHGDPVTHTSSYSSELSSTAFRDEYQAAYFNGITGLIRKAIPTTDDNSAETESLEVANRKEVAIYEVGNRGILKLTDESNNSEKPFRFLAIITVLLTIIVLVLFPHIVYLIDPKKVLKWNQQSQDTSTGPSQHEVDNRVAIESVSESLQSTEAKPSKSRQRSPEKRTLAKAAAPTSSDDHPQSSTIDQHRSDKLGRPLGDLKLDWIKYHSLWVSVLASVICVLPLYVCEQEKTWSIGLVSGVSVVPSIVLLTLTLPWSWRRTLRGEVCSRSPQNPKEEIDDESDTTHLSDLNSKPIPLSQAYDLNKLTDTKLDELTKEKWPGLNAWLKKWFGLTMVFMMLLVGLGVFLVADDLWLLQISLLSVVGLLLPISSNLKFAIFVTTSSSVLVQIVRLGAYEYSHVPARDVLLRMLGDACFMVAYWWLLTGLVKMTLYNIAILMHFEKTCRSFSKSPKSDGPSLKRLEHSFEEVEMYSESVSRQLFTLTLVGVVVCFARLPVYDAWGMSVGTWFTIIFPMILPVLISLYLKRSVQRVRSRIKSTLEDLQKNAPEGDHEGLKNLAARIDRFRKGAFALISEDPVIASILAIGLAFFSGPFKEIIPVAKTIFQFWVI